MDLGDKSIVLIFYFKGTDIAYLFPDLKTALLGEFIQGKKKKKN